MTDMHISKKGSMNRYRRITSFGIRIQSISAIARTALTLFRKYGARDRRKAYRKRKSFTIWKRRLIRLEKFMEQHVRSKRLLEVADKEIRLTDVSLTTSRSASSARRFMRSPYFKSHGRVPKTKHKKAPTY